MELEALFLIGFLCIEVLGYAAPKQGCSISKIYGYKSADCYNKNLHEIPQNIPNNVEVIDLSYNRIRRIEEKSLKKFGSLKMLYLQDNMITKIDENAFESKDDLETLDISLNGLISLPPVMFQLPSLRNLYLSRNLNINLAETIEKAKPIKSPLVKLDVSNNELETLPDLGTIPSLITYNISGNGEMSMTTKHFAGICNLLVLDNTNVTGVFFDPCDCWNIENWLRERKVKFTPFDCELSRSECFIPEEDLLTFSQCKEIDKQQKLNKSAMQIGIPIACVSALLLLICLIWYIRRCRRNKKSKAYKSKKAEGLIQDNN